MPFPSPAPDAPALPLSPSESSTNTPAHQCQSVSPSLSNKIRIRNRRKRYLESHPSYLGPNLESADPLLYDTLIRKHQTPAEHAAEQKRKGFAGTLEADLLRSEARLDEVRSRRQRQDGSSTSTTVMPRSNDSTPQTDTSISATTGTTQDSISKADDDARGLSDDLSSLTREEAQQHWRDVMTSRFLVGEDEEFEYDAVDGDERWDDLQGEERERMERWFDEEDEDEDKEEEERKEKSELRGETGVQDF